jgi:hypothetical protein
MFFLNTTHLSIELVELIRNISRLSNSDLPCPKKEKKIVFWTFTKSWNILTKKKLYVFLAFDTRRRRYLKNRQQN